MKKTLNNNKGVTMVSLVITVVILLILTGILLYNSSNSLYLQRIENLKNDIEVLSQRIEEYYEEYGAIPAKIKYNNTSELPVAENDTANEFYVIDLEAMQGISLNYGRDYETVKNLNNADTYTDLYIINKDSHNIYYVEGVVLKSDTGNQTFHTTSKVEEVKVDLRYIDGILIPDGFYHIGEITENGNKRLVISTNKNETVDTTKVNQYVWIPRVSQISELPPSVTLSEGQTQQAFFTSVNYFKGYFKNTNGYVQYATPIE